MNRPHDQTIAQAGPQDDAWESELEAAFFDPADDGFDTVDAAPERVDVAPPAESIDDPDTLEQDVPAFDVVSRDEPVVHVAAFIEPPVEEDDLGVIQVVPRWVWPTVGLMAVLAVGGTAFGLGAIWATRQTASPAESVVITAAPAVDVEPAALDEAEEVPLVRQKRTRARKPRPLAPVEVDSPKRVRKAKPRPLAPAPKPTVVQPHVPAAPGPAAPSAAVPPTPAVGAAGKAPPASVSDLPTAVSIGALKPGSAL